MVRYVALLLLVGCAARSAPAPAPAPDKWPDAKFTPAPRVERTAPPGVPADPPIDDSPKSCGAASSKHATAVVRADEPGISDEERERRKARADEMLAYLHAHCR